MVKCGNSGNGNGSGGLANSLIQVCQANTTYSTRESALNSLIEHLENQEHPQYRLDFVRENWRSLIKFKKMRTEGRGRHKTKIYEFVLRPDFRIALSECVDPDAPKEVPVAMVASATGNSAIQASV